MDFEGLASRLGIDKKDFMELAELFIETSRSDMDKIRQGMQEKDPLKAASASHSIKGAAGNLGFDNMATLAEKMEFKGKEGSLGGFEEDMAQLENFMTQLEHAVAEA